MNRTPKYSCITVKSVTYAQKSKKLLASAGIDGYVSRRDKNDGKTCLWCVKVRSDKVERSTEILKKNGVVLTGEIYEIL